MACFRPFGGCASMSKQTLHRLNARPCQVLISNASACWLKRTSQWCEASTYVRIDWPRPLRTSRAVAGPCALGSGTHHRACWPQLRRVALQISFARLIASFSVSKDSSSTVIGGAPSRSISAIIQRSNFRKRAVAACACFMSKTFSSHSANAI